MRRVWKDYFKDLYNIDTQEQVVAMYGFNSVQRGNYVGGGPIRTEVEARVRKVNNGKVAVRLRSREKWR